VVQVHRSDVCIKGVGINFVAFGLRLGLVVGRGASLPRGRQSDMSVRAFAILDLASFRHEIAEVKGRPGRQEDLHLVNLISLLKARQYELSGIAVALPILSVSETPDMQVDAARELAARSQKWVQRERNRTTFEVLQGGIDGSREIGVDDLIVVRALLEAEAIRSTVARKGEKILILSHDSDLQHLSQFADGVQIRIIGHRSKFSPDRLRAQQVECEGLSDGELRYLSQKGGSVPTIMEDGLAQRRGVAPIDLPPVFKSPTVAVVDGYGLACSAASALGISELPNAESVRSVLSDLGLGAANSVQFIVPDVNLKARPRRGQPKLSSFERSAWASRDSQLDQLVTDLQGDNDTGTDVVRGVLSPAHLSEGARLDPARRESVRNAKQHSTLITATVVRHWLGAGASNVIVVTDIPDVVVALDYLIVKHGELRPSKITRVGTRARPLNPLLGGRHFQVPFVVLTERRLGQMTRLRGRGGRSLRAAMGVSPTSKGLLQEQWQIVGYEPEVRGLRARSIARPDVEVVIMDTQRLGLDPDAVVDGARLNLAIYGDPNKPIDPLLVVSRGAEANDAIHTLVAEVAGRDSESIQFDIDGDGSPDVSLTAGHDYQPVRAGAPAILGYLKADARTLRYIAINDDVAHAARAEERARVVSIENGVVKVSIEGRECVAHSIQQSSLVGIREGETVLVIDVGSESAPHHVVLSSALVESSC
jgi:hypothetical protein